MKNNSSLEDFEKALQMLDEKLEEINHPSIVVQAIGGFAMLYRGIREHGYTIDIDSLTNEFDDIVKELIREIGKELGLDEEWLNTDCATLEGFLSELESDINWERANYKYKKIDLYIADIIGLLKSKVKAVHDGGLVPRLTDKEDMLSLLRMLNIYNIEELDKQELLQFIREKYERSYRYLTNINEW